MDIQKVVHNYFKFRGYKVPNATEAMLFLTSEVGELADEVVQGQSDEWVRNNPEEKGKDLAGEIGDVLMMLTALATCFGIDPLGAMLDMMEKKGFNAGQYMIRGRHANIIMIDDPLAARSVVDYQGLMQGDWSQAPATE